MSLVVSPPPPTPVEPVTEILHGVPITDPYRWLEDQNSPRVREWIQEQTAFTRAYFDFLPLRDLIRSRVTELLPSSAISDPWNVGERYFYLKRYRDSEQPVIVMTGEPFGEGTILVDPTLRSQGNSAAVSIVDVSCDGRFLAYSIRNSGKDQSAIEIIDTSRNYVLADRLPEGFCTGFTFASDNSGFYYSLREVHDTAPNRQTVMWHRLGTDRSEDQEVFFANEATNLFVQILHSPKSDLLAYILVRTGKIRTTSVYLHPISAGGGPKLLLRNIVGLFMPFFVNNQMLAYTDSGAPNFRIVHIDLNNPDPSHWRDIVPEDQRRIQQFAIAGEQIFITRVDRFSMKMEVFGLNGIRQGEINLPSHSTIDLLNRTTASEKLFYSYTSLFQPRTVCCYDTRYKKSFVWDKPTIPFDPSTVAIEEVIYHSKDGTVVPLLLAAKKERLRSGPLPTFLTGYGGFGSCVTPRFTIFATFLIEQGFLLAIPAVRGGAELGECWHLSGKRDKRQKAFDDFIAAAEWLVAERLAAPNRIAIGGGSNAGLLVAAVTTQRPDLFRAAICLGPLLDMTRYHLFDSASAWADEYGSPDDRDDFEVLLAYSPYHHVEMGAKYPAVLLISGDADTRCNPMHARKMTARLQAATGSGHSILLDYKPSWGHVPVQSLSNKVESLTDRLAFVCQELSSPIQQRGAR